MKAVLISIRPEWCEKIANGESSQIIFAVGARPNERAAV